MGLSGLNTVSNKNNDLIIDKTNNKFLNKDNKT